VFPGQRFTGLDNLQSLAEPERSASSLDLGRNKAHVLKWLSNAEESTLDSLSIEPESNPVHTADNSLQDLEHTADNSLQDFEVRRLFATVCFVLPESLQLVQTAVFLTEIQVTRSKGTSMVIVWSHPLLQIVSGMCACVCVVLVYTSKCNTLRWRGFSSHLCCLWGWMVPPYIQLGPDTFGHLPKAVHFQKTGLTLSQAHGKLVLMVSSLCCYPAWGGVSAGREGYVLKFIS